MGKDGKSTDEDYRKRKIKELKKLNEKLITYEIKWHASWMKIYNSSLDQKMNLIDHDAKRTVEYADYKTCLLERHVVLLELEDYHSTFTDPTSGSPSST